LDLLEEYDGVESGEIEVIHCVGVQNADDFMFISPLNLSLASEIAPTKIAALYYWAEEMIAKVHKEQKESIAELKALRNMLKYIRNTPQTPLCNSSTEPSPQGMEGNRFKSMT
jgi:hypothetical protein